MLAEMSTIKSCKGCCSLLFLLLFVHTATADWNTTLDTKKDLYLSWKLRGSFEYVSNGTLLKSLKSLNPPLPATVSESPIVKETQGIWVITPAVDSMGSSHNANSATFQFSSFAQLMESVSVRYNAKGAAEIFIRTELKGKPLYTINVPTIALDDWVEITVPVEQSHQFIVEAYTPGDPDDYILIDRIVGNFVVTTTSTSPRPPRTTTSPTPQPVSRASTMTVNSFDCAVFIISVSFSVAFFMF